VKLFLILVLHLRQFFIVRIVKNLIISLIGYDIEIRGIPENYLKIINNLIWGFIWNNTVNQVDRNVCCMDIEVGELRAQDKLRICVFYAMKTSKNACIIRSECTHYAYILLCKQIFQIRSVLVQSCT
jgi:hypothetical protein